MISEKHSIAYARFCNSKAIVLHLQKKYAESLEEEEKALDIFTWLRGHFSIESAI